MVYPPNFIFFLWISIFSFSSAPISFISTIFFCIDCTAAFSFSYSLLNCIFFLIFTFYFTCFYGSQLLRFSLSGNLPLSFSWTLPSFRLVKFTCLICPTVHPPNLLYFLDHLCEFFFFASVFFIFASEAFLLILVSGESPYPLLVVRTFLSFKFELFPRSFFFVFCFVLVYVFIISRDFDLSIHFLNYFKVFLLLFIYSKIVCYYNFIV